jgi:hypothetical protein
MKTILAGTDLSESSVGALVWAADLASAVDGRMIAASAVSSETMATRHQIEEQLRNGSIAVGRRAGTAGPR